MMKEMTRIYNLKSQVGVCRGDVVQQLIRVLADERLFVIASCKIKSSDYLDGQSGDDLEITYQHHAGIQETIHEESEKKNYLIRIQVESKNFSKLTHAIPSL